MYVLVYIPVCGRYMYRCGAHTLYAHACRGQRSAVGVVPQVLSDVFF